MDILDIIERFNNNDLNVEKYFNDYETFFNILKKRNLMGEIDPKNASESEEWQNEYLLWLYENDKEKYYKWIPQLLGDVVVEDGKVFLEISDRGDLGDLFCDGRNDLSSDTITKILSGNGDFWEPYWNTTDDVYRDVVEELNPKNLQRLCEKIVFDLKDVQVSPETELLELIAQEQNHPEYAIINQENVIRIVDDEETMQSLLDDEISEIKSELYQIHSNSYNSAYENEIYKRIWSELNNYFEGHGEFIYRPHPYKKETKIEYFKIPISDFEGIVNDYLYNNREYGNRGTLEYQGSFLGIIKEDKDCLSVRVPDYPDPGEVDENINLYFSDFF